MDPAANVPAAMTAPGEATTEVVIVVGGPTGLVLALELGRRGIRCRVLEARSTTSVHPQANANSARTMERYCRLGLADEVRSMGLPPDHASDVAYFTDVAGYELARFPQPSSAQARAIAASRRYVGTWFAPELPHRGSQLFLEPILPRRAAPTPGVSVDFGWRVVSIDQSPQGAVCTAEQMTTGRTRRVAVRVLVGGDGPHSTVRKAMGIDYVGEASPGRAFHGWAHARRLPGRPRPVPTRPPSPASLAVLELPTRPAGGDGRDRRAQHFSGSVQLAAGEAPDPVRAVARLRRAFGADVAVEMISWSTWTALRPGSRALRSRPCLPGRRSRPPVHPHGGHGYNSGIDDPANLGWKLAARLRGWAGPFLLASYGPERRPVAERNTAFARAAADSIGHQQVDNGILRTR